MIARGLHADRKTVRDFLVGQVVGAQLENLNLAFGQFWQTVDRRS